MNDIIQDLYYQCDTPLSLEQFRAEINRWVERCAVELLRELNTPPSAHDEIGICKTALREALAERGGGNDEEKN